MARRPTPQERAAHIRRLRIESLPPYRRTAEDQAFLESYPGVAGSHDLSGMSPGGKENLAAPSFGSDGTLEGMCP